jgi:HK97 family phage major capsid protein
LRKANVRFLRPGWILSPRTEWFLLNMQTTTGEYTRQAVEMQTQGTMYGYPYRVSTQVLENTGSGSDETYILFCDFADVIIGEVPNVVVQTSSEAAYYDGANVVSAFSLDQTVIKMIIEHDLAVRHQESLSSLTAVRWGLAS